jgi:MoxR-like ATPase
MAEEREQLSQQAQTAAYHGPEATEAIAALIAHGRREMAKIIVGQTELVDGVLIALICGGHVLVEGVPGLGKTLAVKSLSRMLQLGFHRVQCTSDLMPSDLLGTNVLNMSTAEFSLHKGPMFTDLLLVDEINRMPPRTQASLLESMEERQVTIDGVRYPLPQFFTVLATQNPVEFEGTYPLPEAQVDRFLLKIKVAYPSADEELKVLEGHHAGYYDRAAGDVAITTIGPELLQMARAQLKAIRLEESLLRYITEVVRKTRTWPSVSLGASPRAAVSLMLVAKAQAALDGRDFVVPDDVKLAALPALRHRMVLRPEAELEGVDTDRVVNEVLGRVEVPR